MLRRPAASGLVLAFALARAELARAQQPLEVQVRGPSAGGFVARTSTDTTPREPIDAASMLDELPSVHVRRLGPEGSFAALSVRGSAPSQVGVVLGGIPLTSAADPAFDVGALPLWPGASFRVHRGFAPASLGTTGYLGGVLAIDAPSPAVGGRSEQSVLAGSFGALKLRMGDLRRVGDIELGTGFFASRADGDFPYLHQDRLGVGPLREVRRVNAGQVVVGGVERVALERPWGTVAALLLADARRLGVPGTFDGAPVRFATVSTSRLLAGLETSLRTPASGAVRVQAWARRETTDLDDTHAELDRTHASTTRSAVLAAGGSLGWRGRPVAPLTLGLLVDARAERFAPLSGLGQALSAPADRLAGGVGIELDWRPLPELTVNASARVDARHDDARGFVSAGASTADGTSGGVAPTGHVGASYRLATAAVVSAHLGALARPPAFAELYGNGASLVAAPSLRPEHAISADLGLAGDADVGPAQIGYELVGFVSDARDLIVFQPLGRATFRAANVQRALLGGGELSVHLVARRVRTQLTYTLLLDEDRATGRPLPGRPRHDLAYDAAYALGPARLRYGIDLVSGVLAAGQIPLPPRIFHSAGVAIDVPWVAGLRVALEVQNLFDQRVLWIPSPSASFVPYPVVDFLGYPLPGRTFWGTVRFMRPNPPR